MVVGELAGRTDLAIIGAGPGGYVAALRAADAGLEVTIVDRGNLGGTCLNVGCIPSKALLEVANLRHAALNAQQLGLTGEMSVDMSQLRGHLVATATQLRRGVATLLSAAGVTVMTGTANFSRYDRLSIEHNGQVSHLEFEDAIVATGSRPTTLAEFPIGGPIVDSTGLLDLAVVPESVAVIGGGYIGVELGTALAKLGSTVTIIEAASRILPSIPEDLGRVVVRRLNSLGVRVITEDQAAHPVEQGLDLTSGGTVAAEVIVVAVGRTANSDTCSLEKAGATIEDTGLVNVGPDLAAAPNIYAIGDLVAGPALAHKASAEAEVAVANIVGRQERFDPAAVPAVVFSDPEIMSVGVTPRQAAEAGLSVHGFPHAASARARTVGRTEGMTIIVCDDAGTIVGVHCAGPHASELAGEATLAIEMAATIEDLSLTIHPHPTMSETLPEAAWLARGAPLHIRR